MNIWIILLIIFVLFCAFIILFTMGADVRKRDVKYQIEDDNEQMKTLSEWRKNH